MKKFIIVLMVVAVASFLFVGCLSGTTIPDTTTDTTIPTTVAPIITAVTDINIASSATQYVNAAEAADGITVTGTAPTYSEIKVYINGITAGTGDAGADGEWDVVVANADLIKAAKVEGAKVLHATAEEPGLPVSDSSNVINFILDTVIPFIASSVGTSGTVPVAIGGTVVELLLSDTGNFFDGEVVNNVLLLVAGNWKIEIKNILDNPGPAGNHNYTQIPSVVDSGDIVTFLITSPSGVQSTYSYSYMTSIQTFTTLIPGVSVNFPSTAAGAYNALAFNNIGAEVFETVTTQVLATAGWITVTFNEDVTAASILGAGNWTAFAATVNLAPLVGVRGAAVARLTETTVAGLPNLRTGRAYSVSCSGIIDLAGNTIPATAPSSSTGVVQ